MVRTALVLEGGGLRGAYTAGALSWLIDNNIGFDNAYGISTGAVYLSTFLMHSKENLYRFSVEGLTDKRIIGLKPLLRSGRIVDYDFLYETILPKELHYDLGPLKECGTDAYIGVFDLEEARTVYLSVRDIDMKILQASTTLPIIGKIVDHEGREIMDGGITDMIPIEKALADGCDRNLVITTKPGDYERKPAKEIVVSVMKHTYPQCPQIAEDYRIRHLNYRKQIDLIKKTEEKGEAVYIYPSRGSKVTRLGGSREDLTDLYDLGYSDMEARRDDILALLNRDA